MLVYWIYPKEEVLFNRKIRGDEWLSYNPFHLTCKWERRAVISLLAFMFTLVFPSLLFFSVPHIVQPHAQVFVHAWGFLRSSSSKKVRCLSNSSYCRHLQENSTGSTNLIYPNLKVTLGWVLFDLHTNTHTTSSIHPFLVARVSLGDLQTWSAAMSFAEWGNQKKLGVAILKQTSWDTSDTQISVSGCHVEAWKIAFGAFSSAKKTGWAAKPAIFLFFRPPMICLFDYGMWCLEAVWNPICPKFGHIIERSRLFGSLQLNYGLIAKCRLQMQRKPCSGVAPKYCTSVCQQKWRNTKPEMKRLPLRP